MAFQPDIHQELVIEGVTYRVAEHPVAPGMPYGQEGRAAVVYQLVAPDGDKRALKVFKPRFRVPALVSLADKLAAFADLPGLGVCCRTVLSARRHGDLLRANPDLTYAVLMPWIDGPTWTEVILTKRALTRDQSLLLGEALAEILAAMEEHGMAHCDLSASNLILPALALTASHASLAPIELVDVEQLYAPELTRPEVLPSGSPGYAHTTAREGLWSAKADRFAGAILIAKMLGWCDARVRNAASGEQYFDPDELQRVTERYHTLGTVLLERWGEHVANLFERVWHSELLDDCPTFAEWLIALPPSPQITESESKSKRPLIAQPSALDLLLADAAQLEEQGDIAGTLNAYQKAIARLAQSDPLRAEIELIIANLERRSHDDQQLGELLAQAEAFVQSERWREAAMAYRAAIAQAPASPQAGEWSAALQGCEEEAKLAGLFDAGFVALQRGDKASARELLSALVYQVPDYVRGGQYANTLLRQAQKEERRTHGLTSWVLGVSGIIFSISVILVGIMLIAVRTPRSNITPSGLVSETPSIEYAPNNVAVAIATNKQTATLTLTATISSPATRTRTPVATRIPPTLLQPQVMRVIDDFTQYSSNSQLRSTYISNPAWGANDASIQLATVNGSNGMLMNYKINRAPPDDYVMLDRCLDATQNWNGVHFVEIYIENDNAQKQLMIQFGENLWHCDDRKNVWGSVWQSAVNLVPGQSGAVRIPVSDFKLASWPGMNDRQMNLNQIGYYAVGVSGSGIREGTIRFGEIQLMQ